MSEPTPQRQAIFYTDWSQSYIPEILLEMYRDKVYQPYEHYMKDGVVFDIGGNIGLFTQFASRLAKKVVTVEPAGEHLETLRYMTKFNKIENVTIVPRALSHIEEEATLYHNTNKTAHGLFEALGTAGKEEKVQTITLDKLMEEQNIDRINFLKLDCEGQEAKIIGSESFKNVADKIDAMVCEFHAWGGVAYMQLINTLRDLGFKVVRIPTDAYVVGCTR